MSSISTNMAVNTETTQMPHPAVESVDGGRYLRARRVLAFGRPALLIVVVLSAVVLFQWRAGAYNSEFSSYPDEASHFMSGLLVHNYLRAGVPQPAMSFAEQFYVHYPYIAIGHWPPLFYALEGGWMWLFSPGRISVLLLMALITTALALATFNVVQREFGQAAGAMSALLLIAIPIVQQYAGMVMLDTLVGFFSFLSVLAFGRYLDTERQQYAIAFGVLSALSLLTKASGFFLALVPAFGLLLSRRFHLLRRPSLWIAAAIVAGAALPWHVQTMHLYNGTFNQTLGWAFVAKASSIYSAVLLKSLGPALLLLAAVGFIARIIKPCPRGSIGGIWVSQVALVLSFGVFYCAIPAGIEGRFTITLLPCALLLANAGAEYLSRSALFSRALPQPHLVVLGAASLVFFAWSFNIPKKTNYGFAEAADAIAGRFSSPALFLVSSDTLVGEGVFVSEMALHQNGRDDMILRASKVLADDNWTNAIYRPRYANAGELNACLSLVAPDFIVLDTAPGLRSYVHHQQLREIVKGHPEDWRWIGHYGRSSGPKHSPFGVDVYEHIHNGSAGHSPVPPAQRITTNLHGSLAQWPITVRLACGS